MRDKERRVMDYALGRFGRFREEISRGVQLLRTWRFSLPAFGDFEETLTALRKDRYPRPHEFYVAIHDLIGESLTNLRHEAR